MNSSTWNSLGGGVTGSDPNSFETVKALSSRSDTPVPVLYAAGRIVAAGGVQATPVVELERHFVEQRQHGSHGQWQFSGERHDNVRSRHWYRTADSPSHR